jgi:hypothetical protein
MPTFSVHAGEGTRGVTVTDDVSGIQQPEIWVENSGSYDFHVVARNDGTGEITLVTRPDANTITTIQLDHASVSDGQVIELA